MADAISGPCHGRSVAPRAGRKWSCAGAHGLVLTFDPAAHHATAVSAPGERQMTAGFTAGILLTLNAGISPVLADRRPERISHPKHVSKAINILWRDPGQVEALNFAS